MMDCPTDRRNTKSPGRWSVSMMLCAALMSAIFAGGCTKNASSKWAQTSPVIKADATRVSTLDMNLRGS